jgi:cellulase/cellobiase CelA1
VTVTVTTSGGGGSAGCTAAYRIVNQWPGGFQAEVTVRNGTAASTSWTVAWTFANGQAITNLWNGVDTASGAGHTVRNANYNGSLAANGTASFGFTATWNNATNAVPALSCARS